MNGTTQDCNQRKHVREHVLADAAIHLMNGESPALTPSAQAHLERCDRCAARLDELRELMSIEREDAIAVADTAFPESRLRAQRKSILARLEQARAGSRVLHFPTFPATRTWMTQRNRPAMRWLAGAAAAGLLVGLGAGQLAFTGHQVRFHSTSTPAASASANWTPARWRSTPETAAPHIEQLAPGSEEAFLSDMELVLNKRRNAALRALDERLAPNDKERRAPRRKK
jgi:anti-sigma factor RsiW